MILEAALKDLSLDGKIDDNIESIVSCLIMRLLRRMCNGSEGDGKPLDLCVEGHFSDVT